MEIAQEHAPYRVIGVLFKTYILLECEDAFLLIDQHAAHERLRYDALARAVEEGVASQRLLTPQIVRVSGARNGSRRREYGRAHRRRL